MTTPTGYPYWVRANDHTTYGGHVEKRNHQGIGAINPRTDVTAEEWCRIAADVAAIQRVAPFAVITLQNDDTSPDDPDVTNYKAGAGSAPTCARVSDGVATITWNASYADEYSVSGDIDIQHVEVTLEGNVPGTCTWVLSDPDANSKNERVTVYCWDDAGAALTDASYTVTVYTGGAP